MDNGNGNNANSTSAGGGSSGCDSPRRRDSVRVPGTRDGGARLNWISGQVVDAAIRIHAQIGPGLIESVYERVLGHELFRRGLQVERQRSISLEYDGMLFENVGRADLVIEDAVIVEVKSAAALAPIHHKQLLTYLRLLDHRLGLVLNFGAPLMKDGIHRIVNKL